MGGRKLTFLVSMYTPYMPLQMFSSSETLATSFHLAQIHARGFATYTLAFLTSTASCAAVMVVLLLR